MPTARCRSQRRRFANYPWAALRREWPRRMPSCGMSLGAGGRFLVLAGEQRGWELCRITALVLRPRMVLPRAEVRLHEFAIEVPSRVSEHRHDHGQTEEERQR